MWPFASSQPDVAHKPPTRPTRILEEPDPAPAVELDKVSTEAAKPLGLIGWPNERLSIPFPVRAGVMMATSFFSGFILGSAQGGTRAGDRYRAENAHRLPTTQTGWYLYHKSKNYHVMLGGGKEGCKYGSICTAWWTLFMVTEEVVDRSRARLFAGADEEVATGQRDFGSTIIAAMTVSNIYSWKRGLDHFAAARTASTALRFSVAYGLVQDLIATLRGSPPAYIRWLRS